MQKSEIRDALKKLDPENDKHWTRDGAPALEALDVKATREEVTEAAPTFTRENLRFEGTEDEQPSDGSETTEAEQASLDEDLQKIDSEREDIRLRLEKIEEERSKLTAEKAKLEQHDERLAKRRGELAPRPNQAESIQAYLAQQHALRMQRATGAARLESLAGGKLPDGMTKAPIDRVRQRSLGHGQTVKRYPQLGGKD